MIPLPKTCLGCPLHGDRKGFSLLEGDGSSGLMVIAESLGRAEEIDGLPLRPRAPSGGVFQRAANSGSIDRKLLTITNTIRCKSEAPYPPEAIVQCRQYLDAAIEQRQPKLILTLGDVPLKELSLTKGSISELRGFVLPSRYGVPMIATYHPSFLARGAMHLFGVFMHDLKRAYQYTTRGIPEKVETHYDLAPTMATVSSYIARLVSDSSVPVAYDIETGGILGEDEPAAWAEKRIVQIQFSSGVGEALVLEWPKHKEAAQAILATPNRKLDWFGRLFDRKVLRAQGITINGETHDLMDTWGHLQPNFMSSKDDAHGDKGVPSKLMSLQSCVSFYFPNEGVWKGMVDPSCPYEDGPERTEWFETTVMPRLQWYGARDADLTYRVGEKLFAALHKLSLYDGYYETKYRLGFVLDDLTERGLPVDKERQAELREFITEQEIQLSADLQALIPEQLLPTNRKEGYKGLPKDLRAALKAADLIIPKAKLDYYYVNHYDVCNQLGYYVRDLDGEFGLVKVLPFNSNSSQQLLEYIRFKGYRVPTHIDTGRDTTGKEAIEALIAQTDDSVLKLVQKIRKLTKLGGTYANGDWVPNGDGRVHGTFRFGTASGQTSCTRPNIQQFPEHYDPNDAWITDLMHRVKGTIRAERGHVFVKTDLRAFHARVQAFLAEDAVYYRMSDFDPHSYSTAHYVGEPDANDLMAMDDESLKKRLGEIKKAHAHDRNAKVKRCIAEGQLVLTNSGLKPIEKVLLDDRVWDGIEWVTHEGVIYQGEQDVITYYGLTATPDHKVYTRSQDGPTPFWLAATQQSQLVSTAIEGTPVRLPHDCVYKDAPRREGLSSSEGVLFSDWHNKVGCVATFTKGHSEVLQEIWKVLRQGTSESWSEVCYGLQSLQSSTLSCLQRLWGQRNQAAFQDADRIYRVHPDGTSTPRLQGSFYRPDRQQWSLRTWQPAPSFCDGAGIEQTQYNLDYMERRTDVDVRLLTYQSLLLGSNTHLCTQRSQWRADNSTSMESCPPAVAVQKLAETPSSTQRVGVYDILNAGPRNRFTVSGKLVANCTFLMQFGGGADKMFRILHGGFDSIIEVQQLIDLIKNLFPKTFRDFPNETRRLLAQSPRLVSPFGCTRWFWDQDAEQGTAFRVSNCAHCTVQAALVRLHASGTFKAFNAVNFAHDALWSMPLEKDAEECKQVVTAEFEQPSSVLVNSLGNFFVHADSQIGYDMDSMEDF